MNVFFKVNAKAEALPYTKDHNIKIYKFLHYIVFDSKFFNVHFDGIQFVKVRHCGERVCGLCGNNNNNDSDDNEDIEKYIQESNNSECKRKIIG